MKEKKKRFVLGETYSASRDCCRPVPHITTSQRVSEIDSMFGVMVCRVWREGERKDGQKKFGDGCEK